MKKALAILLAAPLFCGLLGCLAAPALIVVGAAGSKGRHYGDWIGNLEGIYVRVSFERDNMLSAEVFDDEGWNGFELPAKLAYEIDYSQTPIHVDFVDLDPDTGAESGRVKGIMNFISQDVMALCFCFNGNVRPEAFEDDPDNDIYSLILHKRK
jgi:hypothetical protein